MVVGGGGVGAGVGVGVGVVVGKVCGGWVVVGDPTRCTQGCVRSNAQAHRRLVCVWLSQVESER